MKAKIIVLVSIFCMFFSNALMAQTTKFKWVDWDKLSVVTKEKLKKVKISKDQTIYSSIRESLSDAKAAGISCDVSIAVVDLDGDGIPGYAIGYSGSFYCGSAGCSFTVYEKNGRMTLGFYDEWELIKPLRNGVRASNGRIFTLVKNDF